MIEILKTVIYGLLSGLSEIVPVSSRGHQAILMQMFGMTKRDPILDLMVHLGILACIVFCYSAEILQFRIGLNASAKARKALGKEKLYENRLLRSAMIPLLIPMFFYGIGTQYESDPLALTILLVINGIILFVPDYIRQSNKNAGQVSFFDSILIGLSNIASIFPGLSRVSAGIGIALARGVDKQNAFKWVLILSVPVLLFLIVIDLISIFTVGLATISLWLFIGYILSAAAAFAGGYIGIMLMRLLSVNSGFSGFAYYSWGAAAFTFVLYLFAY